MDTSLAPLDWQSAETHVFLNPQMATSDHELLEAVMAQAPHLPGHVWLSTSGSTRAPGESSKMVALSKHALLTSAAAVNAHVQAERRDRWLLALPSFHVGGLSIWARAHLTSSSVQMLTGGWEARAFHQACAHCTLSAVVPTQVYDLVQLQLSAPPGLRAVIVGGSALAPGLYQQAHALGWPLLPSFGMTECCSQVATAELHSAAQFPRLRVLPHILPRLDGEGRLGLVSDALLTLYGQKQQNGFHFWDPKVAGIFWSEDRVELDRGYLQALGRGRDFIKILGENISLSEINMRLAQVAPDFAAHSVVVATPHPRQGASLVLVTESEISQVEQERVLRELSGHLLPVARIEHIVQKKSLPRTALGKIQLDEILRDLKL